MVNGIHGIDIHHLAPLRLVHTSRTTISHTIVTRKKYFEYFSKNLYGTFTMIPSIIIEIIT